MFTVTQYNEWNCWVVSRSNPTSGAEASHDIWKKLSVACEKFEKFSIIGLDACVLHASSAV